MADDAVAAPAPEAPEEAAAEPAEVWQETGAAKVEVYRVPGLVDLSRLQVLIAKMVADALMRRRRCRVEVRVSICPADSTLIA